MKLRNWHPSNFILAQLLHFFVGSTFVFAAVAFHRPWYVGALIILSLSAIKETTFDIWVEGDSYRDGLLDWLFYALGCLVVAIMMSLE